MGMDKGLLKVNDRYLVEYVIDHLKHCVRNVIICSNNPEYKQFGLEVVPDILPNEGPAGGIYTALSHASTSKIFVISCDTPFIDEKLINEIISKAHTADITVPVVNGWMEPLAGVYSVSCLPVWRDLVDKGIFKLQTLIEQFNYRLLDFKSDLETDDISFMNINTLEDLDIAKKVGRWL